MDRGRAIILGLATLYRLNGRATGKPLSPTIELRAVLALLHAHSNGDRAPYDAYWRAATENGLDYASEQIATVCRRNEMLAHWHRIARSLGTEATIDLMSAIHGLPMDKGDSP